MGLTNSSVGKNAADTGSQALKREPGEKVIALAGNPNVGKSTVFNGLTGMNQHTGNWAGKTVCCASGRCKTGKNSCVLVDIPGAYSLMAHSAEEQAARDFVCFSAPDAVVVVCDATCLERNLNLVLQITEVTDRVAVCVNLMDEAKKKGIHIDLAALEKALGVPVAGTAARKKGTLAPLLSAMDAALENDPPMPLKIEYPPELETAASIIQPAAEKYAKGSMSARWLSLRLLDMEEELARKVSDYLGVDITAQPEIRAAVGEARAFLQCAGVTAAEYGDMAVAAIMKTAEAVCKKAVTYENPGYAGRDRRLDRLFTGRVTAYPVMLLLLAGVFWLTIVGANYPSQILSGWLFGLQDKLTAFFHYLGAPEWLHGVLVLGLYRVLAWVVSVMLPPMAIFFPLFTLLEDAGYLPRIAYNLDKPFQRCHACGKQALTMCMGFGCNAAGVVGCRIIDSPRERLLAILTNSFVPCNGRFPALIAIITIFFAGSGGGASLLSAGGLVLILLFGVFVTFAVTAALSKTVLKGQSSSFTLEMPPYRAPQVGRVIVRSIFDRTLFVLGRAVCVAAPAGVVIWLLANVTVDGASLLNICAGALDPFARLMGLDGVILLAFILGFPANEIVIPIIIMAYSAQGTLTDVSDVAQMGQIFADNGWTWATAVSVLLFFLLHWPCSTTLITIKKETGSAKWTALAAVIPTVLGVAVCMMFTLAVRVLGLG